MAESLTIARPYAHALFELALGDKQLEPWSKVLSMLSDLVATELVGELLLDPKVTSEQMVALLEDIIQTRAVEETKALADKLSNLLHLLAAEKRLGALPDIQTLYHQKMMEHEGIVEVVVTSAYPFEEQQKDKLLKQLGQRFDAKVSAAYEEDEDLIGGMVVQSNKWVIDASIRSQLDKLKESFT